MPRNRPLVLTVDDNPDMSALVQTILTMAGFECLEAHSGTAGLRAAEQRRPDLIILDWMMPDVDGLEVLQRLKSTPDTSEIPVVMFSAKDQPEEVHRALRAGASDFWVKSQFDFDQLVNRSCDLVRQRREAVH
jgi:DNA-binding response OmpR family regulator